MYKGIVARFNDKIFLFFLRSNGEITDGIGISDRDQVYSKLTSSQIACVQVETKDGTKNKDLEEILVEDNWDDIFLSIQDKMWVTVTDDETQEELSVEEVAEKGDLIKIITCLFNDKEIYP